MHWTFKLQDVEYFSSEWMQNSDFQVVHCNLGFYCYKLFTDMANVIDLFYDLKFAHSTSISMGNN